MGKGKGRSKSKTKGRDKTREKAAQKRLEQEVLENMEKAADWANQTLMLALDPVLEELDERDDPYEITAFGPALLMMGTTFALETIGKEETLKLLKDMIRGVKNGEIVSLFGPDEDDDSEIDDDMTDGREERDDSDEDIPF